MQPPLVNIVPLLPKAQILFPVFRSCCGPENLVNSHGKAGNSCLFGPKGMNFMSFCVDSYPLGCKDFQVLFFHVFHSTIATAVIFELVQLTNYEQTLHNGVNISCMLKA